MIHTHHTAIKLCRRDPVIQHTRRPTIEPFNVQRHQTFIKRTNAILALLALMAIGWLGYEIVRGYRLGNQAFHAIADRVGESLAGGMK